MTSPCKVLPLIKHSIFVRLFNINVYLYIINFIQLSSFSNLALRAFFTKFRLPLIAKRCAGDEVVVFLVYRLLCFNCLDKYCCYYCNWSLDDTYQGWRLFDYRQTSKIIHLRYFSKIQLLAFTHLQ